MILNGNANFHTKKPKDLWGSNVIRTQGTNWTAPLRIQTENISNKKTAIIPSLQVLKQPKSIKKSIGTGLLKSDCGEVPAHVFASSNQ